ncbi:MAG: bis(5'-nucleosyl)-tetraphosphatase (symmetrical) YqeK [bacterium]|nr:bis(5'-nucleosyl)-tetraphosphatase (symmetrical) YqeK [bacterium]
MIDIAQIEPKLKEMLSENRYSHCLNTQKIASFLAQHYVVNPQKVRIAALLHDCAKDLSVELSENYIRKYAIILDEIEKNESRLWHGPVGSVLAKEKFGIADEEIGRAIRIHSTLDKNASTLEKIIYVADYMDYRESKEDEQSYERLKNIAITELDIVTFWIINFKMLDILKYHGVIHPRSIEARNELVHKLKDKMKYYDI